MSLTEERLQILKMVQDGTITAEEAAKLLSALEMGAQSADEETATDGPRKKARWLRIRVNNTSGNKEKVAINLPIGLVNIGMKIGAKFVPELQDLESDEVAEVIEQIKKGGIGKIVEVHNEDGEHVEIFVE